MLSDSDVNIDRNMAGSGSLKRKGSFNQTKPRQATSTDAENRPPAKRTSGQKDKNLDHANAPASPANKKPKTGPGSLVELKNGKLVLKQKNLNWALTVPVMKAIIDFQTFLAPLDQLPEIPKEQLHTIAKLSQESDKSLVELAKTVRNALMPEADLGSSDSESSSAASSASQKNKLSLATIQSAITSVAERRNYGIDTSAIASNSTGLSDENAIPTSLQLWRWEVKDENMIPKENLDKVIIRRKEREEARTQAQQLFANLKEEERQALLTKNSKSRLSASVTKELLPAPSPPQVKAKITPKTGSTASQPIEIAEDDDDGSEADTERGSLAQAGPSTPSASRKRKISSSTSSPQSKGALADHSSNSTPKEKKKTKDATEVSPEKLKEKEEREAAKAERLKAKEAKRLEREAKELEKQKLKEAREAELKKVEEKKKRQANFFTAFVKKAAAPNSPSKKSDPTGPAAEASKAGESKSDFDKTFLPCTYKDLAPINRFVRPSSQRIQELDIGQEQLTREQMLSDFKARSSSFKTPRLPRRRRGVHPSVSVREIKRIVTESDVLGGNAQEQATKALETLQDRNRVQIKLLQFESDRRPGWYGTWTKSTNLIGPRCPLGQDPVSLDYSYDSDADWEELGQVEGEDVQDGDDKEDDSVRDTDDDSEMDDWLVDDLEVEEEEEQQQQEILLQQLDHPQQARRDPVDVDMDDIVEVDAKGQPVPPTSKPIVPTNNNILHPKKKKKVKLLGRRFETKLVPFSTGPHWESVFGTCDNENFSSYRIEMLNDACFGLNPFTFTSAVHVETEDQVSSAMDVDDSTSQVRKANLPAGGVLAALWASATSDDPSQSPSVLMPGAALTSASSSTASNPTFKHQLKEDIIPHLLKGIEGSTKTRAGLIDDLKEMLDKLGKTASKNAIGERLSAYAKKEKKPNSPWIVKDEFRNLM